MFSYKTTLILLTATLLFGCQPEGDPNGHWHIPNKSNSTYFTLDIFADSTVITNMHSIQGNFLINTEKDKSLIYLWECGSGVFKYKVRGDAIYLRDHEQNSLEFKGYRCNQDCCNRKQEMFLNLKIDIELAEINKQRERINPSTHNNNPSLKIPIGKPKKIYKEHYGDTIVMQLNDKFSPLNELNFFIEEKLYNDSTLNRQNIHIDILADKNTPLKQIRPVIEELKRLKMENIWIGYFSKSEGADDLLEYVSVDYFDFNSTQNLDEYIPIKKEEKKETEKPVEKPKEKKKEKEKVFPSIKKPAPIRPDVVELIRQSSLDLSGTKYSISKKTDCSGMFHKLLNTFKDTYPEYLFPNINNARSSRDIALWYHKNGDLQIVRDVKNSSDLIEPGMVMFYGYANQKYKHSSLDMQQLITRGKGINHVAVVTQVNRKNGIVESYDIFHGRNLKHPASITTSRKIYPHRSNVPAYGNGLEPWLAVASILTPQ